MGQRRCMEVRACTRALDLRSHRRQRQLQSPPAREHGLRPQNGEGAAGLSAGHSVTSACVVCLHCRARRPLDRIQGITSYSRRPAVRLDVALPADDERRCTAVTLPDLCGLLAVQVRRFVTHPMPPHGASIACSESLIACSAHLIYKSGRGGGGDGDDGCERSRSRADGCP